jgi:hypothetical protein
MDKPLVLTELYPEMREYRAALAAAGVDAELAEEEARQATAVLGDPDGRAYVSPEVPDLIQGRLNERTVTIRRLTASAPMMWQPS